RESGPDSDVPPDLSRAARLFAMTERRGLAFDLGKRVEHRLLFLIKLRGHFREDLGRRSVVDQHFLPTATDDLVAVRDEDAGAVLRLGQRQLLDRYLVLRILLKERLVALALDRGGADRHVSRRL